MVRSTARGQLHRLVLVEGLRQGRDHHLGDPADRLPVGGPGPPGVRAARLPARRGVLLVHLLADPGALPVRPRRAGGDVPRGQGPAWATRCWPGPRSRTTRSAAAATSRPAARAAWCGSAGTRPSRSSPPPTCTRSRRYGPDRVAGFSPIPAMSMVSHAAGARFVELIGGVDDLVLRLVRRPAGGLAAGLRRPDRRPGVRRLVGRRLPDHVGLQRPGHPHPGRALDGRGPLPRPEGGRGRPRLRRQREVRRRVAGDGAPGTDGALAMSMGHVILKEFFVDRQVDYFVDYCRRFTDLPFLVTLEERATPTCPASSSPPPTCPAHAAEENAAFKTVLVDDAATGEAGGAQRVPRAPLRRRGRGQVEPRPRRRRPAR